MIPTRHVLLVLAILAGSWIAGCMGPGAEVSPESTPPAPRERPLVVAVLDTGINPYHEAFRATPGADAGGPALALLAGAEVAMLSQGGDFEARLAQDEAFWEGVQMERLYAFAGTRLMAYSASYPHDGRAVLDPHGHGTGVASVVLREAPEAIVVMVQVDTTACDPLDPIEQCPVLTNMASGMQWAAEQPWIDVISLSLGVEFNVPFQPGMHPEMQPFLDASRLAHDRGKLIVAASGNTVVPPLGAHYAGPPWVIAVGGGDAAPRGEAADSGRMPDVVANTTAYVPLPDSVDGFDWSSGTSFSAPLVAGVLARAAAQVREAGVQPTPPALRDALNASAVHFAATEWDPTNPPSNDTGTNLEANTLPVLVPFLQMGWGHVDGSMASEIARRVVEGDFSIPADKALTARHQANWQALREAYWARHA